MQFEVCTLTAIRKRYINGAENRAISTITNQLRREPASLTLRDMMRDDKPLPVYFLVDISRDVVELGSAAVFHFLGAGFLTHLIRHATIDVNVLVRQRYVSLCEKFINVLPILLLGVPADNDCFGARAYVCDVRRMSTFSIASQLSSTASAA